LLPLLLLLLLLLQPLLVAALLPLQEAQLSFIYQRCTEKRHATITTATTTKAADPKYILTQTRALTKKRKK